MGNTQDSDGRVPVPENAPSAFDQLNKLPCINFKDPFNAKTRTVEQRLTGRVGIPSSHDAREGRGDEVLARLP